MSDTENTKLAKTQKALINARRRIETQEKYITALENTLAKCAHICVTIDASAMSKKIAAVNSKCAYGFTHFCDGKVNESEAREGTKPLPPCPHKAECALRKMRLV